MAQCGKNMRQMPFNYIDKKYHWIMQVYHFDSRLQIFLNMWQKNYPTRQNSQIRLTGKDLHERKESEKQPVAFFKHFFRVTL